MDISLFFSFNVIVSFIPNRYSDGTNLGGSYKGFIYVLDVSHEIFMDCVVDNEVLDGYCTPTQIGKISQMGSMKDTVLVNFVSREVEGVWVVLVIINVFVVISRFTIPEN